MRDTVSARKKSKLSVLLNKMKKRHEAQFVVCLKNDDYPASLEVRKIYRVLSDPSATKRRLIRIVDESGEDYLYPLGYFAPIEIPRSVEQSFAMAV